FFDLQNSKYTVSRPRINWPQLGWDYKVWHFPQQSAPGIIGGRIFTQEEYLWYSDIFPYSVCPTVQEQPPGEVSLWRYQDHAWIRVNSGLLVCNRNDYEHWFKDGSDQVYSWDYKGTQPVPSVHDRDKALKRNTKPVESLPPQLNPFDIRS